jgi:serine/threonine protein kinase
MALRRPDTSPLLAWEDFVPPPCPTAQNLRAFHQGTLAEAALDALADHLETCPECDAAMRRLESEVDPLLSMVRKRARALAWSGDGQLTGSAAPVSDPDHWSSPPGYEIVAPLGQGGMGVVYSARQLSLNRLVALKRLRPGTVRARAEAEALARLQHPGIVQIYEVIDHEGRIYLALEMADAGSLRDRLTGRPESPRRAAELVESLARAVHYAHGLGIIHRDLKPANILLHRKADSAGDMLSDFLPKVADFGVAKWLERDAGHTRDGEIIGTPAYMAPEQTAGTWAAIGPATDVYGFGVVLYELLTGRVPLQGPTTLDTLVMVRTEEPVPPRRLQPRIPRDLETICLKCLAKHHGHRYAGARDLADDLRRFLDGRPIVARPTSGWERAGKWAGRQPAVAGLSAGIVVVVALGFALVSWQWRRAEQNAADEAAARRQVERLSAGFTLDRGVALCESGDVRRGLLWLARALEVADRADDPALAEVARLNLAAWQPLDIR